MVRPSPTVALDGRVRAPFSCRVLLHDDNHLDYAHHDLWPGNLKLSIHFVGRVDFLVYMNRRTRQRGKTAIPADDPEMPALNQGQREKKTPPKLRLRIEE